MSLLNEMLHDLAKHKKQQPEKPSLTAALSQPMKKSVNKYAMAGVGIMSVLLIALILKPKTAHHPQVTDTVGESILPVTPSAVAVNKASTVQRPKPLVKHQATPQVSEEDWYEAQMSRVSKSIEQGNHNQAVTILKSVLVRMPASIPARQQLAALYLAKGEMGKTETVVAQGLEYSPENPGLIAIKAKVFVEQGQLAKAIKLLKSDHPSMALYPQYYSTLAQALEADGQIADAGSYYKSLIKLDPNNGSYWIGYAKALEADNNMTLAIDAYKRASDSPNSELAVRNQAESRLKSLLG